MHSNAVRGAQAAPDADEIAEIVGLSAHEVSDLLGSSGTACADGVADASHVSAAVAAAAEACLSMRTSAGSGSRPAAAAALHALDNSLGNLLQVVRVHISGAVNALEADLGKLACRVRDCAPAESAQALPEPGVQKAAEAAERRMLDA